MSFSEWVAKQTWRICTMGHHSAVVTEPLTHTTAWLDHLQGMLLRGKKTIWKGYIMYAPTHRTFFRQQNYRSEDHVCGCQGLGTGKLQKEALAMEFYTVIVVLVTGIETQDENNYTNACKLVPSHKLWKSYQCQLSGFNSCTLVTKDVTTGGSWLMGTGDSMYFYANFEQT